LEKSAVDLLPSSLRKMLVVVNAQDSGASAIIDGILSWVRYLGFELDEGWLKHVFSASDFIISEPDNFDLCKRH
jgi:hypothetical protein